VLDGAHEKVVEKAPVLERRFVQGPAAAPSADQVEEGVHAAEAVDEGGGPIARLPLVEEVDGAAVPAVLAEPEVGGEVVEAVLVEVGGCQGGAGIGKSPRDDGAEAAGRAGDRDDAVRQTRLALRWNDAPPSSYAIARSPSSRCVSWV
jgi:hypothetical protein